MADSNERRDVINGIKRRDVIKASGATLATAGIVSFAGCSSISGGDDNDGGGDNGTDELPEMTIDFATGSPESWSLYSGAMVLSIKEYLERKTDGKITINIHPLNELGDTIETLEQSISGDLPMVHASTTALSDFHADQMVWDLPFQFEHHEVANQILYSEFGDKLWDGLIEETGLRPFAMVQDGDFNSFGIQGARLTSVDDFQGKRFRVSQNPVSKEIVNALGAEGEVIPWAEMYQALDQGVVDGQDNPLTHWAVGNLWEVQDFFVETKHNWFGTIITINESYYQDLPTRYQGLINQAGMYGAANQRRVAGTSVTRTRDLLEEEGVEMHTPSEEFRTNMRELTREPALNIAREEMDNPELIEELETKITEVRERFGL